MAVGERNWVVRELMLSLLLCHTRPSPHTHPRRRPRPHLHPYARPGPGLAPSHPHISAHRSTCKQIPSVTLVPDLLQTSELVNSEVNLSQSKHSQLPNLVYRSRPTTRQDDSEVRKI